MWISDCKEALGADRVELAVEEEFQELFRGCEVGAMPPFGNLYDVNVYVAQSMTEDEDIALQCRESRRTHSDEVRDFDSLVQPATLRFAGERA